MRVSLDGHTMHRIGGDGGLLEAPIALQPIGLVEDPGIVEVTLVAELGTAEYLPGVRTEVWTFNGSVPGPTLRARIGDRIVVHFRNELPEPTTIHWHGVRLPAAMDGTTAAQSPIPPGGSFDYEFRALDAGTFWYHPHVRSDVQIEKGLYGAIVVTDPDEPDFSASRDDVLVLDDVLLDPETGALDDSSNARVEMMGREGNLLLVSGARSGLVLGVDPNEVRRLRMVNASNSRHFRIGVADATLVRVGGDGGLLEAPERVEELTLVPGERADTLVWTDAPGRVASLRSLPHERALGAGATEEGELLRFVTCDDCPEGAAPELPSRLRTIAPPAAPVATREIRLSERMEGDRAIFMINGQSAPQVPRFESALGTVELWQVVNGTQMDHPFHVHGFFFQREGVLEWKDTIAVPAQTTVPLLVSFDDREGASGDWMYHCHIVEHAERGMMGEFSAR